VAIISAVSGEKYAPSISSNGINVSLLKGISAVPFAAIAFIGSKTRANNKINHFD
jgi:hypothetical protein